ncbi:MAG: cyclic nucleotide-binding protein [Firmicutes bacterium]|nr:cyclic nucleotide-binding protein [Bacillota bacterium]
MSNNELALMPGAAEAAEGTIKIGVAVTLAEKREIYRFRYQIYIEEMSKHLPEVDYENMQLHDDMDEWSTLLYAKIGSKIIATKRITIGTIGDFSPEIIDFLSLETFAKNNSMPSQQEFAFITKVMVSPVYRSSPALYLLMAKAYEICCHNHIQFIFGISHFHLLSLYEQIGCRRYYKNFFLPNNGLAVPIVLLTDDVEYLRKVRSPIFRIARKRKHLNTPACKWFESTFTNKSDIVNSQLVNPEELWSILCKQLQSPPTAVIPLLHELSDAEAKKFLHSCGIFVQCNPGDLITFQGDISYSYNILISGKLKSLTFIRPTKEYTTPGQTFGANGLTEHNKHTEDIAAIGVAELLVLSGLSFQKFTRTHPDIAHKIIQTTLKLTSRNPSKADRPS